MNETSDWREDPQPTNSDDADRRSRELTQVEQGRYTSRVFVGVGVKTKEEPFTEAIRRAYESAWEQAKNAGVSGPLRLVEQHVDGYNPPDWCRVVLAVAS